MVKFYIIRHGETTATVRGQFHGTMDAELSQEGKEQVKALNKYFRQQPITRIYVSPLKRCRQTAAILKGRRNVPLTITPQLREIDFGKWEGLTLAQMHKDNPRKLKSWFTDFTRFKMPGGERVTDLISRVTVFWRRLARKHKTGNIVIVTHGGPAKVIIMKELGLAWKNFWRFHLSTASLNIVELDSGSSSVSCVNCRYEK